MTVGPNDERDHHHPGRRADLLLAKQSTPILWLDDRPLRFRFPPR